MNDLTGIRTCQENIYEVMHSAKPQDSVYNMELDFEHTPESLVKNKVEDQKKHL